MIRLSALVMMLVLGAASVSAAVAASPYKPTLQVTAHGISADLRATPLKQALKMVAARVGVDLYLDKAVKGSVTARFHDLSLGRALKRMLRQRSYILTYDAVGKPKELWLIKEGSSGFDIISGYRGDVRHGSTRVQSASMDRQRALQDRHLPTALGAVRLSGAMGQSYWRHQLAVSHGALTQSSWRYGAIQQTMRLKRDVLRRALATAPPEDRPALAKQMVALAKQEQSLQTSVRNPQIQAAKEMQKLAAVHSTVQLPTQQLAQLQARNQRQMVMLRQRQQQARQRSLGSRNGLTYGVSGRPQQREHRWMVR